MQRKEKSELTILRVDKNCQYMEYEKLREIFGRDLTQYFYLTDEIDRLLGILSAGDVKKRQDGKVFFNRNFSKVCGWNRIKAKKIFDDKLVILEIPVVDENNRIIGAYARKDEICEIEYYKDIIILRGGIQTATLQLQQPVYIVDSNMESRALKNFASQNRTVCDFNQRLGADMENSTLEDIALQNSAACDLNQRLGTNYKGAIQSLAAIFEALGIKFKIVDVGELANQRLAEGHTTLFVTEEEKRAYLCGYCGELEENPKNVIESVPFLKEIDMDRNNTLRGTLKELSQRGIKIITVYSQTNQTEYCKKFLEKKREYKVLTFDEEFFQFTNDAKERDFITKCGHFQQRFAMGTKYLTDVNSKYYNVTNGRRKTFYQPDNDNYHKVYFFGPCFFVGQYVKDQDTIESYLQKQIVQKGMPYIVENCGVWLDNPQSRIRNTDIRQGDIVIVFTRNKHFTEYPGINAWDVCEKENIPYEYFTNIPVHCNAIANEIYARAIYEQLVSLQMPEAVKDTSFHDRNGVACEYLNKYFKNVLTDASNMCNKITGCIIMNANPFTLGHRYLIEQAARMVDLLIVFVVEEDLSEFSFVERWRMVKKGTEDLKNVMVVPSGNFVLSHETFPDYFVKEETEDTVKQTEYDITLFADEIAKPLNIRYRFVGEEISDVVTKRYNEAMKRILPEKGIEVVEIKRKENAKTGVISASKVRQYLEQGELEKAKLFLPETSVPYVI